jgi:formate hydrogenlyase transcriptional activator
MLNASLAGLESNVTPKATHAPTKGPPSEHKSLQDVLSETEQSEVLRTLEASNGIFAGDTSSTAAQYEALIRISNSIRARKDPQCLFEALVRELRDVIPFDAIAQFDESANTVNWHWSPACTPAEDRPEDTGESLPLLVYRTQEIIILGDSEGEEQFPAFTRKMRECGLQSLCALPLTTAHRRLGSLIIASVSPNAYSPDQARFCALVADQIALAIDDAMNFQASQKAQERLQLLLDLTNSFVSNLNLRDVLREVSAQVRRVMHSDGVAIDLPSPEDGKLRLYALDYDGAMPIVEECDEPPAESAPVRAFRTGEAVILLGDEIEDEFARDAGLRSVAHVPMTGHSGTAGVLCLGTREEGGISRDDLPFLNQVAHQVAIAIENARTFTEVSDEKDKLALEKLYLEDELRSELKFEEIVGRSAALRRVLEQIETVAPTDSPSSFTGRRAPARN